MYCKSCHKHFPYKDFVYCPYCAKNLEKRDLAISEIANMYHFIEPNVHKIQFNNLERIKNIFEQYNIDSLEQIQLYTRHEISTFRNFGAACFAVLDKLLLEYNLDYKDKWLEKNKSDKSFKKNTPEVYSIMNFN